MGGLVARSFIMKYQKEYPSHFQNIKFVMTINTPMLGMSSADIGVRFSPIVILSWRDIAPGSDFLNKLNTWKWPDSVPYHLVFSYKSGEGDDGVVNLESQITNKLQLEAVNM